MIEISVEDLVEGQRQRTMMEKRTKKKKYKTTWEAKESFMRKPYYMCNIKEQKT